jgi:hypothetical protein|tara:strand:+ start:2312 stop:2530 length:219 start_codon:yes stop_codon:yes gene_type:complete
MNRIHRGGSKRPCPEDELSRDEKRRDQAVIRLIRKWYFDDHRDRRWIQVQLPDRDADWIWKVIRHEIDGWLS